MRKAENVTTQEEKAAALLDAAMRLLCTRQIEALHAACKGEIRLLDHLYTCENHMDSPSGISSALGVTRSRVTAALSSLYHKGCVTLTSDAYDRRRIHAALTGEGIAQVVRQRKSIMQTFGRLCGQLGEARCETLSVLLAACADILE